MQPDNALLIVEMIARALVAVQGLTIDGTAQAHGCLHPGLILLSGDGEALITGVGLGEALLAGRHTIAGGRAYLAPEVLADGAASLAGDVYSVGAILFHLLTGTALPADPDDRGAALESAYMAWDGEPMPTDIRALLEGTLDPDPENRTPSAVKLCPEIESLIYGGAYSPTTFNLALFMDRLFRDDFDADEVARADERTVDFTAVLAQSVAEPETPEMPPESTGPAPAPAPRAAPPDAPKSRPKPVWALLGVAGVVAVAAGLLWFFGRGAGSPSTPPPEPTPTAEQIAAGREAQEERLRAMTQEMVQQMMAEKEAEIRQELMARQSRIEELQRRLQASERRAARDAAAAANEAATQEALIAEIEAEEEAQRAQQQRLDEEANEPATVTVAAAAADRPSDAGGRVVPTATPERSAQPTARPTTVPTPTVVSAQPVTRGSFVDPEQVDAAPVVLKNQPLTWSRTALRSGEQGAVIVRVTVNADGGVDDVEVLRADHTGYGIPEAAAEAASGCRFKPGMKDGVPVTTYAFITWRYDFSER